MISKSEFSPEVWTFFVSHFRPGRIGFVGLDDMVGMAIREAQRRLTLDGTPSRWSHVFLMGEKRVDGELYIFESDLEPDLERPQFRNGAQESRLKKWCVEAVEHAAVIDVLEEDSLRNDLVAGALDFVYGAHVAYPIAQLVGTWWQIIAARLWRANPFEDATALYCSSFVRHCLRKVGVDPVSEGIHLSNTAPEHLWQTSRATTCHAWRRREGARRD